MNISYSDSTERSRRSGVKSAAIASRRLVRISGEVMTAGAAAQRAGVSGATFTKWYRLGVRTWEGFATRGDK